MDTTIDSSGIQYYSCKYGRVQLLKSDNYATWSPTVEQFLRSNETWTVVTGIETKPTLPEPPTARAMNEYRTGLAAFEKKAAIACSMLLSSVSPEIIHFISGKTDPKDMWDTLKSKLDSMNANAGPFILRSQFLKERYTGTGSIAAFFAKLQQYQVRLSVTNFPLLDLELISHVLSPGVLPPKFNSAVEILSFQAQTTT